MLYFAARHRDTRLWNTFVSAAGLPEPEWEVYPIEADTPDTALRHAQGIARAMQALPDSEQQLLLALALETQHWRALDEALPEGLCIHVPEGWQASVPALERRRLVTVVDHEACEVRLQGHLKHYRPTPPNTVSIAA